jgi:hypothetical protein
MPINNNFKIIKKKLKMANLSKHYKYFTFVRKNLDGELVSAFKADT